MTHARIVADQIVETGVPARRPVYFADRWWDCRDPIIRDAYIAAADWRVVVDVARPADTDTTTHDRGHVLVGGVPTVTWTPRPWTTAEADARARQATRAGLTDVDQLAARLTRLSAYKDDPDIVAALARTNQTAPTTQELNRLIKVMLRRDARQSAAIALLVRLIDPALLSDTTDIADS